MAWLAIAIAISTSISISEAAALRNAGIPEILGSGAKITGTPEFRKFRVPAEFRCCSNQQLRCGLKYPEMHS